MSNSTIDDIKSGKGLKPLQGSNSPKSGVTTEHRSGDGVKVSRSNSGITHETFSRHTDDGKSENGK